MGPLSRRETHRSAAAYGSRPLNPAGTGMWTVLKWLVMRLAIVRWLFKILGALGVFLPLALLLKTIGLPVLIVLGVLALPILFVLFLFGLPFFLVLLVGSLALGVLFAALAFGLLALKFAVFVVLPIWLLWKLGSCLYRGRGGVTRHDTAAPDTTTGADPA
jgi:hypothetical protein